jgi:hypothetical protein
VAGGQSWSECKRVLTDKATLVVVGGQKNNRWFAPVDHLAKLKIASLGGSPEGGSLPLDQEEG